MPKKSSNVPKYIIGAVLFIAMVSVATYAWTVDTSLNTDPTTVYVTTNPGSSTTVNTYSVKPYGKNNVTVSFKLANSGSSSVTPNFQFLDSSGNIITVSGTVKIDGTTVTANTDHTYTPSSALNTSASGLHHWISVTGTGVWSSLGTAAFSGVMIVVP